MLPIESVLRRFSAPISRVAAAPRSRSRRAGVLRRLAAVTVGLLTIASVITVVPGVVPRLVPAAKATTWVTEADRVIEDARQHIGQPYVNNGNGGYTLDSNKQVNGGYQRLDVGTDCKGFVWIVLHETGHDTWGTGSKLANPTMPWSVQSLYDQLKANLSSVEEGSASHPLSMGDLQPGDLVIYGTRYHETASSDYQHRQVFRHVAIYEGNGRIIHDTGGGVQEGLAAPDAQSVFTYFIHTGLSGRAAVSNPLPDPPVGVGKPCNIDIGAYDLFDNGCPTLFEMNPIDGQVWAHPINGQSVGNVPVWADWDIRYWDPLRCDVDSCSLFLPTGSRIWEVRDLTGDAYPDFLSLEDDGVLRLYGGKKSDAQHARVTKPWVLGSFGSVKQILVANFHGAGAELVVVPTDSAQASTRYSWSVISKTLSSPQTWWKLGGYASVITSGDLDGDGLADVLARSGSSLLLLGSRSGTGSTAPTPLQTCDFNLSGYPLVTSIGDIDVNGLKSTPLASLTARAFQLPWTSAAAVAANLTIVKPSNAGFVTAEPLPSNAVTTSSFNFAKGQTIASSVTSMLGPSGRLGLYYWAAGAQASSTANVILDVAGYFDSKLGDTYYPLPNPIRVADSRDGLQAGKLLPLQSGKWQTFQIDEKDVPSAARTVTGTLTVTGASADGYLAIRSDIKDEKAAPTFSNLNFKAGENRANDVTVSTSAGRLSIFYYGSKAGATTHAIFDVTGYFRYGTGGAYYVPLTPNRIVDTRDTATPLRHNEPVSFLITNRSPDATKNVPASAVAVTGTVTATRATGGGYITVATGPGIPTTSTVNFKAGENVANGITIMLPSDGRLWFTYESTAGKTAHVIFDVTGYYTKQGGYYYHRLEQPLRFDTRTDATPDVLSVRSDGTLWAIPGGCGRPYRLGMRSSWPTSALASSELQAEKLAFAMAPGVDGAPGVSLMDEEAPVGGDGPVSQVGDLPAITAAELIDVPFELVDSGEGSTIVELWARRQDTETRAWSPWYLEGSSQTSPIPFTFDAGDGMYELYTSADDGSGPEGKTGAEARIYVDGRGGLASRVRSFIDGSTTEATVTVAYDVIAASDGTGAAKVELYQRLKPVGGSFGSWALAGTATDAIGTPFSVVATADGTYEFYTRAYDTAGNAEAKAVADARVIVNTAGSPTSWIAADDGGLANNPSFFIEYRYMPTIDGAAPARVELYQRFKPFGGSFGSWSIAGTVADTIGTPFSVTATADGTYEFYTRAYDAAGNAEAKTVADASVVLDRSVGPSVVGALASVHSSAPIDISSDANEPADASGVAWVRLHYRYKSGNAAAWPDEWTAYSEVRDSRGSFTFDFPDGPGYYQFYTVAADMAGNAEALPGATTSPEASTKFDPASVGGTFYPLATPQRIVNSKGNVGIIGPLAWLQPRTFQVAGVAGIPADATGITGTLISINQTAENVLALGPAVDANPSFSTLNFSATGNYSAGVTVALAPGGTLNVVLGGGNSAGTVHVILDVTGYFRTASDGATYYGSPVPQRIVDSRKNLGITTGLSAGVVKSFQVTGKGGVPANATVVTGTLTVTGQTRAGLLALAPAPTATPGWASLFFPGVGVAYSASVTSKLGSNGALYIVYQASVGATAKVIFDVTGYFVPGAGGARYFGLQSPTRIVDTRHSEGLSGGLAWNAPRTFQVAGGAVPIYATAISGNPTVTRQNAVGFIAIEPTATAAPGWSTANFPATANIGVGVTTALGSGGTLSVVAGGGVSTLTTDFLFDVTGYFVMPVQ
jgi:hypothetical protein